MLKQVKTKRFSTVETIFALSTFHKGKVKIYIRLHSDARAIEDLVVSALTKSGGIEKFGQTPKGSLERKIQEILNELGMDKEML